MKRQLSNLLKISTLLIIIVTISSCRRNKLPENYYKVGDDVYEINNGKIINNGETEGGFNLDLLLYCENGKDFINFSLVSKEAERIPDGSYKYFDASWFVGYDNGSYTNFGKINSGSLIITRTKDGYVIKIDCIDQYNNKIVGQFTGELTKLDEDNFVHMIPEYILPDEIYDEVTALIPIHSGVNPPNMEGEYVSAPHALIYESYAEKPDSLQFYSDRYLGFLYANKQMNFYGKQYDSIQGAFFEEIQHGVKITGDNDCFTCYYVVDGYVQGYYAQQSFIFSGKKTDAGLEDFHVAVVLLETSGNPYMFAKHSYRILKDYDGLAEENHWLSGKNTNGITSFKNNNSFDIWMK